MKAGEVQRADRLRIQRNRNNLPTKPPRKNAMDYFRRGYELRPPQSPTSVREVASGTASAHPSDSLVAVLQLPQSTPTIDEDTSMSGTDVVLLQNSESIQGPVVSRSTTPSDPPPSPPSPRLRQLDDDVSVQSAEEEMSDVNTPHIRNDLDPDDDIPVWNPEDGAGRSQPLTTDDVRAYQEHLRKLMCGSSSGQAQQTQQMETPKFTRAKSNVDTAPRETGSSTRVSTYEIRRAHERPIHPDALGGRGWTGPDWFPVGLDPPKAQKQRGSDQKLLEELFKKI